ncbi:MAG: class I SAM-dependent methyltransferase [Cyanobacteria bacterium SZAS TMP-1]|nr:class I SAM-dependent methyltransferase [Cyanobacteria bacterium SZAS TMP-1]
MKTGSSYEIYDKTHSDYDKTRLAVGNEQLVAMLSSGASSSPITPATYRILDAGCGTGVHLSAFARAGFTSLTGLDASVTGLAQASRKVQANLVCGDIRTMPFAAASFDLILFSFVLHHLPHQDEQSLIAATRAVIASASELLAPGGRLAIITCDPEQLSAERGSMWYYKYFPEAAAKLAARFLSPAAFAETLKTCGFGNVVSEPVQQTYWTDASLDASGPFDSAWRSGDSLFAICAQDAEKFAAQLEVLRADIESGAVQAQIASVRKRAESVKQATIIVATKN